jgi:hypothetical protein
MLKRVYIWLCRFRHRKGYGVHSPFAFSMIRSVINERGTYYAYKTLEGRWLSWFSGSYRVRQCRRLLFRMANFLQPDTIVEVGGDGYEAEYLAAGCQKATVIASYSSDVDFFVSAVAGLDHIGLLHVSRCDDLEGLIVRAMRRADERSVFIIDNIHEDKTSRSVWKELLADDRTGISFDLYDMGVVMFDRSLNKQHYVVNF